MSNWIKKNPLVHIIFLILSPFDPNYVEFGPQVALFKAEECAEIDEPWFTNASCKIGLWSGGTYKNHPDTLSKLIERAANEKQFSDKSSDWQCSINGVLIADNSIKASQTGRLYKCWPIQ